MKSRRSRRLGLHRWARRLRALAAFGVFGLSLRFSWISLSTAHGAFETEDPPRRERQARIPGDLERPPVDLDELKRLAHGDVSEAEAEPEIRLRQLLIEVGPARSEIYVNGHYVGRSPYVGQWGCVDGDEIAIDVLPPDGMPIARHATCRGQVIQAKPGSAPLTKPGSAPQAKPGSTP